MPLSPNDWLNPNKRDTILAMTAKRKKATKKTRKPRRVDPKKLIEKGKNQGFITQDEILKVFPDAEKRLEELDDLYAKLLAEGVDVFETVTEEEMLCAMMACYQLNPIPNFMSGSSCARPNLNSKKSFIP